MPAGSGNGLARELGISMSLKKAIQIINNQNSKLIDTVKINGDYFLGTAGVGYDAYISWKFDEAPTRGLLTYIKIALKGFLSYNCDDYFIEYNNTKLEINKGFLVTFSNSKQYGNNITISPKSLIDDGLIKLIIVKQFPKFYLPIFAYYLLTKQIDKFKYTEIITSNNINLLNPKNKIHIDGEPIETENKINIKVIPKSLKIIVP